MDKQIKTGRAFLKGDMGIWIIFILLMLISLVEVYSAIGNEAYTIDKSTFGLFIKHFITIAFSFVCIYTCSQISYTKISKFLAPLLLISIGLLIFVLIIHKRWIPIPGFGAFQPSEMAKYILVLYMARELVLLKDRLKTKEAFIRIIIPVGIVCGLIIPQSATAAGITFLSCFLLMIIAGMRKKYLINLALIVGISLTIAFTLTSKYPEQMKNIPGMDRITEGYERIFPQELNIQVKNARLALGTAGVMGKGIGNSQLANFQPEAHNDYIYTIILEEGGFLFGFVVMLLYMILLYRCFMIAKKSKGMFGAFIAIGVGLVIIIQSLINMFVGSGFRIVTGQTLPFISKGGTSYMFACIALGVVLNISSQGEKKESYDEDMEEVNENSSLDNLIQTKEEENR
ncbi:MAG: FtsW/RodA/SpoVE family cell cycle protein [Bacteroidales bacterium]|nr:FtsW/RodA/SpoVE family cell cycle protein [Bacteroidales bacterium]